MSPPCWNVIMTARALGVTLNMKEIDILNKAEQLSPNFLKVRNFKKHFKDQLNHTCFMPLLDKPPAHCPNTIRLQQWIMPFRVASHHYLFGRQLCQRWCVVSKRPRQKSTHQSTTLLWHWVSLWEFLGLSGLEVQRWRRKLNLSFSNEFGFGNTQLLFGTNWICLWRSANNRWYFHFGFHHCLRRCAVHRPIQVPKNRTMVQKMQRNYPRLPGIGRWHATVQRPSEHYVWIVRWK